MLAVVVQRRRADALQLAAGQRGLEDVRGVDSAFGGAGADEHVHLVDEQHAVAGVLDLLDDLLQALFELAAVLGAGDQRADVQRQQALALQRLRHVAGDDAVRQALDDRRLADAGLADQDRVVLRAAREDLNQPLDLAAAADHGVELAGARRRGQVDAQLVDGGRARAGAAAGAGALGRALGEDAGGFRAHALQADAERLEDAEGDALALADEAEEQVLGADVAVVEAASLFDRQLDDLLGARREADLAAGATSRHGR